MEEILVPIGFFVSVVLIVYFVTKFNRDVKLKMIDRGGNINFPKKRFPLLEIAGLILGIGIGLGISVLLGSIISDKDLNEKITGACIFTFAGLGIILTSFIKKVHERKHRDN